MNRRLGHQIRDWLDAEGKGSDELAERALARALAEIGRRGPGAGFADRVLLRAGRLAPALPPWRWRWLRGALAASLLGAGLALAVLPAVWLVIPALLHAVGSPLVSTLLHSIARWISAAFAAAAIIADVGSALQTVLVTPTALVLLTANILLALASLMGLRRLLRPSQEYLPW